MPKLNQTLIEKQYEPGEVWAGFPPTQADIDRLKAEGELYKLYRGEFDGVLPRWNLIRRKRPESPRIGVNFFRTISKEYAKTIFGEKPTITISGEVHQRRLNEIVERSELQVRMFQACLTASALGGSVMKARRDAETGLSHIETVKNSIYFPIFDPDDETKVVGVTLAWIREDYDDQKRYLVREIHRPGQWMRDVLDMSNWHRDEKKKADWYPDDPSDWTDTGYDGIPVEYIPNTQLAGEFLGESDYRDIKDIIEEIMVRASDIADILNKHAHPGKVVPNQVIQQAMETSRESLIREHDVPREMADVMAGSGVQALMSSVNDLFGVDPDSDNANLPRYVTWDASLPAAWQELDKLFECLIIITCLPAEAFTPTKAQAPASGTALRLRDRRTIAEANQKRLFILPPIKRIIRAALAFEGIDVALSDISITTEDGLPFDQMEATQVAVQQKSAGIASMKTLIRIINPDLTDEAIEQEIADINAEDPMTRYEEMPGFPGSAVNVDGSNSKENPSAGRESA